jgi:hypothetical protein
MAASAPVISVCSSGPVSCQLATNRLLSGSTMRPEGTAPSAGEIQTIPRRFIAVMSARYRARSQQANRVLLLVDRSGNG